jgi:hypothetical protein
VLTSSSACFRAGPDVHDAAGRLTRRVRYGPCPGGPRGSRGLHGCACEGGSRASWHDGGYSAERSACSLCLLQNDLEMRPARCNEEEEQTDAMKVYIRHSLKWLSLPGTAWIPGKSVMAREMQTCLDYITLGDTADERQTGAEPFPQDACRQPVDNSRWSERPMPRWRRADAAREPCRRAPWPGFFHEWHPLVLALARLSTTCVQVCG